MKQIKVGVIGCGRIGRLHIHNILKHSNVQLVAVSDINIDSILPSIKHLPLSYTTDNYEDIISDESINAVFICTPTNTHAQIIQKAAQKKKHVFCEKPVSFSYEETKEVIEVAEKENIKLQIGFNRRFDHNFHKVKNLVVEGEIGTPHILKITSRDPEPPSESYIQSSGGLFIDMSIHDFDMARYIMESEVVEVFATGANLINPAFKNYDDIDTAVITLKFENGSIGVIDNSRKAVYGYDQRIEVFGSDGCITVANERPTTLEISTKKETKVDLPHYFFLERYQKAYEKEVISFIQSIIDDRPILCTGYDGLQAERIAYAAKESLKRGIPVRLEQPLTIS